MSTPDTFEAQAAAQWDAWWAELWPVLRARWCAYLPEGWEPEIRFTPKVTQIGRVQGGVFHADPNRGDLALLVLGLAAALTEKGPGPSILVNPDWGLNSFAIMALIRSLKDYPGNVIIQTLHRPADPRGAGYSRQRAGFEVDELTRVEAVVQAEPAAESADV